MTSVFLERTLYTVCSLERECAICGWKQNKQTKKYCQLGQLQYENHILFYHPLHLHTRHIVLPSRTTSLSFSTASAKRATARSSGGMSSTSITAGISTASLWGLWAIAARPWPLLNTQDWIGKPAALALRLRAVGLFSVPAGDGQPTSFPCGADGVPGQLWPSTAVEQRLAPADKDADEEEELASEPSFRGCSWRIDS